MCFYHDAYAEFAESCIRKARKTHRCDECGFMIEPGEHHHYTTGKCDGDFYTTRVCRRCCYDIARIVAHEQDEGCRGSEAWPPVGDCKDYLDETEMGRTERDAVPEWFDLAAVYPHQAIERLRKTPVTA